jgi:hypothetical protein
MHFRIVNEFLEFLLKKEEAENGENLRCWAAFGLRPRPAGSAQRSNLAEPARRRDALGARAARGHGGCGDGAHDGASADEVMWLGWRKHK